MAHESYRSYNEREAEERDSLFALSKDALRDRIAEAKEHDDVAMLGFIAGFAAFKGHLVREMHHMFDMDTQDAVSVADEPALVDEWWGIAEVCELAIERIQSGQTE